MRRANSENKPPLPDAEVQRTARSVWRYKMNNTLMVPGSESSVMLPSASITRFLDEGDIDGIALMALFRRAHGGQPGKEFAASPAAMERDRCIGSWDKRRYRTGIRKLCELGELVQIAKGGKGKRDPALYRLGQPKKGGNLLPNTNQTPPPSLPQCRATMSKSKNDPETTTEKKPGLFEPGGPGGPGRPQGSRNAATLVLEQIADDAGKAILEKMAAASGQSAYYGDDREAMVLD